MVRADFFQQDSSAAVNTNSSNNIIGSSEKGGGGSTGGARSSQVSLSSNPDLDFRYSAIFTEVAFYRGRLLAVKRVRRQHIDINREIKKELKIVSSFCLNFLFTHVWYHTNSCNSENQILFYERVAWHGWLTQINRTRNKIFALGSHSLLDKPFEFWT